jgi:hypothetical protein
VELDPPLTQALPKAVNTRGSIALGDLRGKLTMLEIACSKCDRPRAVAA